MRQQIILNVEKIYKGDIMKERISKKGKEHFNYERKRNDLLMRNLLNNPKKSNEYKEELLNKMMVIK